MKLFDARNGIKQRVNIPELDEATAHTLVNYMYTQQYQSLRLPQLTTLSTALNSKSPSADLVSYRLSTRTYTAAVTYTLPGLAELAKERITLLGEDVDVFDILDVARDYAYPTLPESDEWYTEYLEGVIRSAMKEDAERFRRPEFLGRVDGCGRLLRVVWGAMMSGFAGGVIVPTSEAMEAKTEVEYVEKGKAASSVDVSVSAGTNDSGFVDSTKERFLAKVRPVETPEPEEHSLRLDDMEPIEPLVETPTAPEVVEDEIDFRTSKMGQQWGKKSEQSPVKEKVVVKLPERPKHARSDSVLQKEVASTDEVDAVDVVDKKEIEQEHNVEEGTTEDELVVASPNVLDIETEVEVKNFQMADVAAPLVVDGSGVEVSEASTASTKKDKKKKGKKKNPTTF